MDFATARRSALSQLRARLNEDPVLVAAFWTEIASADRIANPNLTVLYCSLTYNRKPYTILEFVAGETLEELVKRADPTDCETAIPLFCRVLDAFEDADKKPAHMGPALRTFSDTGATLTDFGLCRVACATTGFCHGTILVTPEGVSREEIIREETGTRQETLPFVLAAYQSLSGEWPQDAAVAPGKLDDIFLAPLSKSRSRPEIIEPRELEPETTAAPKRPRRVFNMPPWLVAVMTSAAVLAGLTGAVGLASRFGAATPTLALPQFPPLALDGSADTGTPVEAENARKTADPIVVNETPGTPASVPAQPVRMNRAADSAAPSPSSYGGATRGARLLSSPSLSYPPKARNEGVSGVVRVEVMIDEGGTVKQQRVLSGHPLLRAGVAEAVKQWVYQPALLNGKPVPMTTEIEIKFNLDQKQ